MAYQEFTAKQGQTAASYQKQTNKNFTHGLGMEDWTWDKDQGRFLKPGGATTTPAATPAPVSGLASATPSTATTPDAGAGDAGGGTGDAAPATGGTGSDGGIMGMLASMGGEQTPFQPQLGPGLRSGLGQRAYPVRNLALAGLKQVY